MRNVSVYEYILFNIESLNHDELEFLLTDLELEGLALFLKNRFNDNRSISVLKDLIKDVYSLV